MDGSSVIHLPKKGGKEIEQYLGDTEPEWLFLDKRDSGIVIPEKRVLFQKECVRHPDRSTAVADQLRTHRG